MEILTVHEFLPMSMSAAQAQSLLKEPQIEKIWKFENCTILIP